METDVKTHIDTVNAKSISLKELYGVLDPDSRDWTDGLLSKIYRNANIDTLHTICALVRSIHASVRTVNARSDRNNKHMGILAKRDFDIDFHPIPSVKPVY